jgi:hypothetical protein
MAPDAASIVPEAKDVDMHDIAIDLENTPGALAALGEALGRAGVSIEGGGAFAIGERGVAHFLVEDGQAARAALSAAAIKVVALRDVVLLRLNQEEPGQLGKLCRRMADARVNIETLYSNHAHDLVLVVDDIGAALAVSAQWTPTR